MKHYHAISFGLALCIIAGMTLDAWAHVHGATDNTFFTPWHAILYTGLFGSVAWYGYLTYRQVAPLAAHRLGLSMGPLVALFGAADLIWHSVFGFEQDLQAQLSPPHIALAAVLAILVSIPSRQRNAHGQLTWLGAIAGSMAAVVMLTLLMFVSPLTAVYAELYSGDTRGQSSHQQRGMALCGVVARNRVMGGMGQSQKWPRQSHPSIGVARQFCLGVFFIVEIYE